MRPDLQGDGIGRDLYHRFFEECRRRNVTRVSCVTSAGNVRSIAFHCALDFEVSAGPPSTEGVPVQVDYDGSGRDRVSFFKVIDFVEVIEGEQCRASFVRTGGRGWP